MEAVEQKLEKQRIEKRLKNREQKQDKKRGGS